MDLKTSLANAKNDAENLKPNEQQIATLQEQLQTAVGDGMELQAELEETRKRMNEMEKESADSKKYDDLIVKAQEAEATAFKRIEDLTAALRKSEELRKETEGLLNLAKDSRESKAIDVTKDPRYKELEIEITSLKQELAKLPATNANDNLVKEKQLIQLQDEMRLLQEDLINAKNLEDPLVADLQRKLQMSRDDAQKLNLEFKNAMEEFGRIKDQVVSLENENSRLRDVSLNAAKSQAGQQNQVLQNRINNLSNENANLSVELGVKDNRIAELREQLVQAQSGIPGLTADSAALNAQIIRLEGMLQRAQDTKSQSNFELNSMKQQLAFAEERAATLKQQLQDAQSQLQSMPKRLPNLPPSSSASPVVISPVPIYPH